MQIQFLGIAGAVPSPDSESSSFLLSEAGICILVDCSGSSCRSIMQAGVDPFALDLLVITHAHADHLGGLPAFLQASDCAKRHRPLKILSNPETQETIEKLMDLFQLGRQFPVQFIDSFESDHITVNLLPGEHSIPTSMVEFLWEQGSCLYSSDRLFSPQLPPSSSSYQTLIHEATGLHRYIDTLRRDKHSSVQQAAEAASLAGVNTLFLCHFVDNMIPSFDAAAAEAARYFKGRCIIPTVFKKYLI